MSLHQKFIQASKRLYHCMVRWWKHEHANTAAALAFYSLISLVPILITGVSIASWIVGEKIAKESFVDGANSIAGKSVADYFGKLLNTDISWFASGASPLLGTVFLLYAATKVIAKLRKSLGAIFGVPRHKGKKAMIATAVNRGIGIIVLLCLGGIISCAVVVETILVVMMNSAGDYPILLKLMTYSSPLVTFFAVVLLSAMAMRWLPQRPPTFRQAIQGGIVSAVLLALLKFALTSFLQYADVGSYYGSSLTLVLVLFWIYFAMQAFLFGAEYTAEVAREERQERYVEHSLHDSNVEPQEHYKLEELASKISVDSTDTPMSLDSSERAIKKKPVVEIDAELVNDDVDSEVVSPSDSMPSASERAE